MTETNPTHKAPDGPGKRPAEGPSQAPALARLKTLALWLLVLGLGAMSLQGLKLSYPDGYRPALWSCSAIPAP